MRKAFPKKVRLALLAVTAAALAAWFAYDLFLAPKPERKQGNAFERAADAFDRKSGSFDKYYEQF